MPNLTPDPQQLADFIHHLAQHPELLARLQRLLAIVDNADGDTFTADQAEQHLVDELRQLGHHALSAWAERKAQHLQADYEQRHDLQRSGKKNSIG